jgi:murein L,D-transpeptidase YcbB/YkuD
MTGKGMLSVVGDAVGGLIGWTADPAPSADPESVRALFADLGVEVPAGELDAAVRRFQARAGLRPDGVAGPQTVHALARYAEDAREVRFLLDAA